MDKQIQDALKELESDPLHEAATISASTLSVASNIYAFVQASAASSTSKQLRSEGCRTRSLSQIYVDELYTLGRGLRKFSFETSGHVSPMAQR